MTAPTHTAIAARMRELATELNGRAPSEVPRIEREVASLVELCGGLGHVRYTWSAKASCSVCGAKAA